jgi:hypothetical protein
MMQALQNQKQTVKMAFSGKPWKKQRYRLGCEGSAVQICPSRPFPELGVYAVFHPTAHRMERMR